MIPKISRKPRASIAVEGYVIGLLIGVVVRVICPQGKVGHFWYCVQRWLRVVVEAPATLNQVELVWNQ